MVAVERVFHDLFTKLWSCLNENTPYSVLRWGISPCGKCPSCLATHGAFVTVVHLHLKSLGSFRLVCREGIPTRSISLKPKACLLCEQLTPPSLPVKHWVMLSILSPRPHKQSHACVGTNPTQTSQPMGPNPGQKGCPALTVSPCPDLGHETSINLRSLVSICGSLSKNGSHRLTDLNACSLCHGTIRKCDFVEVGGALLEEVYH